MKYDVKMLTLDEKLKLLTGVDYWRTYSADGKIGEVVMSDGPCGLRKVRDGKTEASACMPSPSVVANSWSKEAAFLDGKTIADECVEKDVDVILAPGTNIKRTPLCGRNFEYLSEDPYLAGVLAREFINGAQSKGVGTSLKHYCCNNREFERFNQNSEVDERTLREIYLPAFEEAVKAEPWTVMCSYNLINGIYASENKYLIDDVLRGEFGFNGVVVSDWGAVHNQFRRVRAGLDLEMPYSDGAYNDLKDAYERGYITEEQIDRSVKRILELIEKKESAVKSVEYSAEERHANAVAIAKEGIVLLKNDDDILPLKGGKILVSGEYARAPQICGGGSARNTTAYVQTGLDKLISEKLGAEAEVSYLFSRTRTQGISDSLNKTYVAAYDSDTVVICVGNDYTVESEDFDRQGIRLSKTAEDFILNTAAINKNVVVVLYAGSAIDVSEWVESVKAVVFAGFAGEGVNEALSSVLTGETVPSGKLSESFPTGIEETYTGLEHGNGFAERYSDGIFVGYRYYEHLRLPVEFPFGHGLSYAKFTYSDLKIKKTGETEYEVSYNVTNESDFAAKEVSQVYVKDVFSSVLRPKKELKGFSKDEIGAHETKNITVKLDYRSFAYYNVSLKKWYVENGAFEVLVGASSADIRLSERITVELAEDTQYSTGY